MKKNKQVNKKIEREKKKKQEKNNSLNHVFKKIFYTNFKTTYVIPCTALTICVLPPHTDTLLKKISIPNTCTAGGSSQS